VRGPARRENARERLDEPGHDLAALDSDLTHLEDVNRWLGGRRAACGAIQPYLRADAPTRILDVGCGSADVPRAIALHAARRKRQVHIVAADRSHQILDVARRRTRPNTIRFTQADACSLPFADDAFDIVIMSLAFHHFENGVRIALLRELSRVASQRVIINELERCWPNYVGAQLLALTVWRNHAMARHDGPLSVLRSFTRRELEAEMREAGLRDIHVTRRFFHRLVGSATPAASAKRATVATLA
jgi:ubiquinone/menaquinone biosynthesis C-methylase UbiE